MDKWAELRTAYVVAKLGTVRAAAETLNVHRATVTRHIETLEAELGAKIFQRHARGYALTEVGRDMLRVAEKAEALIDDLAGKIRGRASDVSGEIIVTALAELSATLMPAFHSFRAAHPHTTVTFIAVETPLKLEHGEAHVAVRTGSRPLSPDYVVQRAPGLRFGLYAHSDYVARRGAPSGPADFQNHDFIGRSEGAPRAPFGKWLDHNIPPERIVLRVTTPRSADAAILAGIGAGFMAEADARAHASLVEVLAPRASWATPLWLLTHVDLHRTKKIQAMLKRLKGALARPQRPSD